MHKKTIHIMALFGVYFISSCNSSTQDADLLVGKYVNDSSLQLSSSELQLQPSGSKSNSQGTLVITNQGTDDLVISSFSLEGDHYQLNEDLSTCTSGIAIEPGEGCHIDIILAAKDSGTYSGQLLINFQNKSGKRKFQKTVPITGEVYLGNEGAHANRDDLDKSSFHLDSFNAKFTKSGIGVLEWQQGKLPVHQFKISYAEGSIEPKSCDNAQIIDSIKGQKNYTDLYRNLTKNIFYTFKICAIDEQGSILESLTSTAKRNEPEYVSHLTAKLLSQSSVQLSWTSDFEPPLFRVVYNKLDTPETDCNGSFRSTIIDNVTDTQVTIKDLNDLGFYSFRVCGVLKPSSYSKGKIVSINNRKPIPTITSLNGPFSLQKEIPIEIKFTQRVTGFDKKKINVSGGQVSFFKGDGMSFQVTVIATKDGDIEISIPDSAAKSVEGYKSLPASTTVTVDSQVPTHTFSNLASVTNQSSVDVTLSFSEAIKGFDQTDLVVSGASVTNMSISDIVTFTLTNMTEGTVNLSVAAGSYNDLSGNPNTAASTSFIYDITPPQNPNISINSGDSAVASQSVSLSLSASDAQDVYVTNTAGCASDGYWDSYNTSYSWTLGASNQSTNVYVKFRDAAGNMTACISDDIIMDAQNPSSISSLSITIPSSNQISYTFTAATDALSGIGDYQISVGSTSGSNDLLSYTSLGSTATSGTYSLSNPLSIGQSYYINIIAIDSVNNQSTSVEASRFYGFVQEAYLKPSNTEGSDYFGYSVDISGDTIVVGATREDSDQSTVTNGSTISNNNSGASASGAAYVFKRSASSWSQEAYLKAPNADISDFFGSSVAISGDTIIVGAYGEDSDQSTITNGSTISNDNINESSSGAVYVFKRSGSDWSQEAYLKASNVGSSDYFGDSISIYEDTVVVGSYREDSNQSTVTNGNTVPNDNNSSTNSGAAYVFTRSNNTWSQEAYLKASNVGGADFFGRSVSIYEDTIVVGAEYEGSNHSTITNAETISNNNNHTRNSGSAYVFSRSASNWTQEAYLKASNVDANNQFGISASISGDTIVVGAYKERSDQTTVTNGATIPSNTNLYSAGAAYVFTRSASNWSPEAYLKPSNLSDYDRFGHFTAISGNTIAVSAHYEDSNQSTITNGSAASSQNSTFNAGAAYVFSRSASNWTQEAYLKASNAQSNDNFGHSIAISGTTIAVGSPYEDSDQSTITNNPLTPDESNNNISNSGAVYVFSK